MLNTLISQVKNWFPAEEVQAHCDGPCGVYDPSSARITAEAVLSMTQKLIALELPDASDKNAVIAYNNTFSRYVAIKEEQAHKTKEDLLVLWTDYFKPVHLEKFPDLHDTFWKAAKLCSSCKVEVSEAHAKELVETVEKIHNMFWQSKERDVSWYLAKPS
ncbi:MAG: superoxide dismutase, Ni [Spirulina sp.]